MSTCMRPDCDRPKADVRWAEACNVHYLELFREVCEQDGTPRLWFWT